MVTRKLSRRQLAAAMASAAAARPGAQAPAAEDFEKQARDQVRRNADLLAKRDIPMATEPAFHFKA
jgi:hypothetical protein